tara:strand:+ start:299 stop:601 length:303 start_codon:yes stop_codon:yes gene_type:complete
MTETYTIDAAGKASINKDPDEVLDYRFDFSADMTATADTIVTVAFVVTGATLDSQSNTTTTATAWVSGGAAGTTAQVSCEVTTAAGRVIARSVFLKLKER